MAGGSAKSRRPSCAGRSQRELHLRRRYVLAADLRKVSDRHKSAGDTDTRSKVFGRSSHVDVMRVWKGQPGQGAWHGLTRLGVVDWVVLAAGEDLGALASYGVELVGVQSEVGQDGGR